MSYMAIDPEYQSMTVSKILKKCLEDKSNKKDLTIGFARKVMDGYWKPYGFLVSNTPINLFLTKAICQVLFSLNAVIFLNFSLFA